MKVIIFCYSSVNGQSIKIADVIRSAYSKGPDLFAVKNQELNYIVPQYISFIDTIDNVPKSSSFKILFHKDNTSFEKHLKKVKALTTLFIYFDSIRKDVLEITPELSNTTEDQYFGVCKFFIYRDKRRIKLVYNKTKKKCEYHSLVKLFDEPRAGNN